MGNGGDGIGYDGLTNGIAVEFDTVQSPTRADPLKPHVSIHESLGAILTARESHTNEKLYELDNFVGYDEIPSNAQRQRTVTIRHLPETGELQVSMDHFNGNEVKQEKLLRYRIGRIRGKFYVGFTASTGTSFAQFSINNWKFKGAAVGEDMSSTVCTESFDGGGCAITNEIAHKECPRRQACNVCVEDVYNCAWCETSVGPKCVVGTQEDVRECKSYSLEPLSCTAGLSKIWLYMLLISAVIVGVFGVLLFKTLPMVQSFRAISILVSLVGGGLIGMLLSLIISVSLVEISETPAFAIAYGIFFIFESGVIALHLRDHEIPIKGSRHPHVIILCICCVAVFLSGIACFILDRSIIHWLPETPKVMFYTILGACLNFCFVFSCAELLTEIQIWRSRNHNVRSSLEPTTKRSVMQSEARIALLAGSSILSGMFFGFMFGTLRIEEESKYRVALALQQETAYTYPVGAVIGAISSVLYQLVQLPLASDEDIQRLMRSDDGL